MKPRKSYVASFEAAVIREQKRLEVLCDQVMSMESELCDVKIGVKKKNSEERVWIGASKYRLKEQSKFFQAVWQNDISNEESVEELPLDGISEQAMRAIIEISFGQYQRVEIEPDTIADYLYASMKYGAQLLLDCCEETIESWTHGDRREKRFHNLFSIIVDLDNLGMTDYSGTLAGNEIFFKSSERIEQAFFNDKILESSFDFFSQFVQSDGLILDEFSIWKRCIEWVTARCKFDEPIKAVDSDESSDETDSDESSIETESDLESSKIIDEDIIELLRKLKPMIRFSLMTGEELATLEEWEPVISQSELSDLMKGLFRKDICIDRPRGVIPNRQMDKLMKMRGCQRVWVRSSVKYPTNPYVEVIGLDSRAVLSAYGDRIPMHPYLRRMNVEYRSDNFAFHIRFPVSSPGNRDFLIPINKQTVCSCDGSECLDLKHLISNIPKTN